MKKKIFLSLGIAGIMAVAALNLTFSNSSEASTNLLFQNIEALSRIDDDSTVTIPCESATSTCSFSCVLADGKTGTCRMASAKNK